MIADAARLEAEEDLGLGAGDALDAVEEFEMDRLDRGDDRDMRRAPCAVSGVDLAGMVHADLEDAVARRRRGMRASVSGTPQ